MKDLVKQYLDRGISRRTFSAGLVAAGFSGAAAKSMAQSLAAPLASRAPGGIREMRGTGGAIFVQQLKAAGVEYIFFNPSTGDCPIYDALLDEPGIQVIQGVQEGACVAMADGYARVSGKPGIVVIANVGLPNALTQLVNSWKDQIPVLLAAGSGGQGTLGGEAFQEYDHIEDMTQPITKWHWVAQTTDAIAATTRRALKFATTPPCGPVYLSLPEDLLRTEASTPIYDRALFNVPMLIRPGKDDIEKAARVLIEAKNPLISIGDEITQCRGEKELLQLAELLGLPVSGQASSLGFCSKPFPTRHPLFIGTYLKTMRFPGAVDVHLNLGWKHGEQYMPGATQISIRRDPTSLARTAPVDLGIVADLKLAMTDLIDAVNSLATPARLKSIADERSRRVSEYSSQRAKLIQKIAQVHAESSEIRMERLGVELELALEKDTIYVCDVDSGKNLDPFMSFGGDDKQYVATGPSVFGWGIAAGLGARLAAPDRPVVSVVGDGSFLFGGPQPLWSLARYHVPNTVIVLNNKSYNNERNRIWMRGGAQFKTGRDMTCYLGDPDVDYAKAAQAFGVDGENVRQATDIAPALARAKRANAEGRPYLLDVDVQREGLGAASTWYSAYSVANKRTRKV
jgi:benzoylformate decarboxylase